MERKDFATDQEDGCERGELWLSKAELKALRAALGNKIMNMNAPLRFKLAATANSFKCNLYNFICR